MPQARKTFVNEGTRQVFHCVVQCVPRAYLSGVDPDTGRRYGHRRAWVRQRLGELAEVFAVDVITHATMRDRLHLVVLVDPARAAKWRAKEVVARWRTIFPRERDARGNAILPTGRELAREAADAEKVELWRSRLASLSWFMRCLSEYIARRANREDKCRGQFWNRRFRCQRLEGDLKLPAREAR